ncbi:MAG: cadmium-translocating P-type ATPase [Tyzzerella sp.]|nr:cadmium-translocating P-type ATPase [Tyzzerella sp.]
MSENHNHKHEHESCSCGHNHDHEHHHEACCCGHHHEQKEDTFAHVDHKIEQKIYIIENLGCANCAAKMEKKINDLPEVEAATITFATKQLRVASNHHEHLLPVLQEICSSVESEVIVKLREEDKPKKVQKGLGEEQKKEIAKIAIGAVLFAAGIILEDVLSIVSVVAFIISYLLLGGEVLGTAIKNISKGQVFDENFLMSIATIAAFVIGDFAEAVGVMLFFCVGELFEDIAVEKSRGQIMEAVDMRPETVQLVHDHGVHTIPAAEAKTGDILLVRPGDRIPLDGVVIGGESRIDTAPVTGEPVPVKVVPGSQIVSGCLNTSGTLHIRVEKLLEDSMVTRILNSVENAAASKPKIDRFITRFARVYTPFVVVLAVATAILPSLITGDWNKWIYTAITFLVISCPCALVLSVPLAFFSGIGVGSKKKILFKGGLAVETLEQVKAVVMDKTGTITKGDFKVQKCVTAGKYSEEELLAMAAECELQSTHPIANSIVEEAMSRHLSLEHPKAVEEIAGKGIHAVASKGEVLCGNKALLEMHGIEIPKQRESHYGTEVYVACNGELAGYFVISDTLKEDSKAAISKLKSKGIKAVMLTGDASESAEAVAKETGVEEVYAKLLPEEKLERLQEIRQKYGSVMFVGDGINDAPVLAGADVGAAMGSGADAAIEAADVVFMTSSMEAIPEALDIAKVTNRIAIQNIVFALAIKAMVMVLGLFGFANMWMAVFADSGVAMLCVLNSIRILRRK